MTTLNEHDAAALYRVYCDSVGGKAYDGKPLPDWFTLSSDQTKEKQAQAWRDVAHFAFYASEREKSKKLEAEVEKLEANLRRAIEIAEEVNDRWCYRDELDQLKAALSEPNSLQPKPLTA